MSELKFSDYRFDEYKPLMRFSEDPFTNKLMSTHSDNIRDEFRNKNYNRFKDMGRLGKYKTYRFYNNGEELTVDEFKHNFRGRSIRNLLKRYKQNSHRVNHVEYGLPLPVTKNCKLVGVVSIKKRHPRPFKDREYHKDGLVD